jgi:GNAT superfamily N-acetyltransferase
MQAGEGLLLPLIKTNTTTVMSLYTIKTTDTLPFVKHPAGLVIEESRNVQLLSMMGTTSKEDVTSRLANNHVAFVAYIQNLPAAFGWMAKHKATIGELNHELVLPAGNRYLWNFRTMEAFRGLGIYPALLHHIIELEKSKAERFWIIHAPENTASLKGIQKAGFQYAGRLYTTGEKTMIEATEFSSENELLLSEMNISVSLEEAASCWNCSSPYIRKRKAECCCTTSSRLCIGNNLAVLAS